MNDVKINKVLKGLNRPAPQDDSISLLVCGGVSVVVGLNTTVEYNKPYLGYGIEDFEVLGITQAYDTANKVLVWYHLNKFFALAPGQPLWLYLVAQTTPQIDIWDKDNGFGVADALKQAIAINPIQGAIRQAASVLNPLTGYAPAITQNIDPDVILAVTKAQALSASLQPTAKRQVDCLIEGRSFGTDMGTAYDLRPADAEYVNIVVAQDLTVCAIDALHEGYGDIGTYLGMVASKFYSTAAPDVSIADSPAAVGLNYEGNIQDTLKGFFVQYGMGNQALNNWSDTDQTTLELYHYVGVRIFANTQGVYFNQSATCAADTSDFTRIQISRVWNKADRSLYAAYVPFINKKWLLNKNGTLPGEQVKYLESVGNAVFNQMRSRGEISAGATYLDPKAVYINNPVFMFTWKIVPCGYSEQITGQLEFTVTLG